MVIFTVLFAVLCLREAMAALKGIWPVWVGQGFWELNDMQREFWKALDATVRSSRTTAAWSYGFAAATAFVSFVFAAST